jgi:Ribbon-helix-helix protein, copG family
MNSTLTVRLPAEQRRVLREHAAALKKTESEVVRDALAREMASIPILERLGNLVGSLDSSKTPRRNDEWSRSLRERNWRT